MHLNGRETKENCHIPESTQSFFSNYFPPLLAMHLFRLVFLGLIPGLGRSPGEGNGYPLQYSGLENSMDYTTVHGVAVLDTTELLWTSLVAQTVKRLFIMRETLVRSLGWEDPLEKEMATHSSTVAWKILWMEEPGRLHTVHGVAKVPRSWANHITVYA